MVSVPLGLTMIGKVRKVNSLLVMLKLLLLLFCALAELLTLTVTEGLDEVVPLVRYTVLVVLLLLKPEVVYKVYEVTYPVSLFNNVKTGKQCLQHQ